ncbi:MAG TPA: hypothetical protein GXZ48_02085 [Acholeplasmataceae bacterium]|nr:hypothetical protein [Acholeplasmataceae bacterium]
MKIKYIVLLIILLISLGGCFKHIDDTNGDDDYTIETFSDADITKSSSSYVMYGSTTTSMNSKTEFKVQKFSGIRTLETVKASNETIIFNFDSQCISGNLRIVIVQGEEIIKDVNINGQSTVTIENANGTYILKVVGESAKFKLEYSIEK